MEPCKVKEGKVLGLVVLNNMYWYGAASELERLGYVNEMYRGDRRRGKRRPVKSFRVLKRLPEPGELTEKVNHYIFTKTMAAWYEDARSEVECLYEEMDQWRDGMEQSEGLSQSSKFSEVETAADELRELCEELPDELPEFLRAFPFFIAPDGRVVSASHRCKRKRSGRAARAYDVVKIMEALVGGINFRADEYIDDDPGEEEGLQTPRGKMTKEEQKVDAIKSDVEELLKAVDEVVERIEQIEFPGMY